VKQYCYCYCRCQLVPVAASAPSALCGGWKLGNGVPWAIPDLTGLPSWPFIVIMTSASSNWITFCADLTQQVTCVLTHLQSSLTLLCDMFSQTGEKVNIYCPRRCHQRHISDRNLLDLLLTWLSPTMWAGHCVIRHFNLLTVQCHFQNIRMQWSQTAVLVHLFYWAHQVCVTSNN